MDWEIKQIQVTLTGTDRMLQVKRSVLIGKGWEKVIVHVSLSRKKEYKKECASSFK